MTGRLAFLERGWGGLEPFDVTLPSKLREEKIFTHIVTDHYHYFSTGGENYCQSFDTWDFYRGQESDPWISRVTPPELPEAILGQTRPQYELNRKKFMESEAQYPGPQTMQGACRWLEENQEADQFFLMVEAFDPHEPFDCPQHYLDLYDYQYEGPRFTWPKYGKVTEDSEAMEHVRIRYAANLTMIDTWLGKLLDVLDRQNLWEDTLIIFTTDHGFLLGEHEWTGKNIMHVYNEIAHLPLMIHVPGASAEGKRIPALTQNIDLMPTILSYFGLETPSTVRGKSHLGLIHGTEEPLRDYALYGMFGLTVNMTDGNYTYFRAPVGEDNHPSYIYTAMPTMFRRYLGAAAPESIENGRFLTYTEYPVFRIPASIPGAPLHLKESLLFDIASDYHQLKPIQNETLKAFYAEKLREAMEQEAAPAEQYVRLGF